MATPVLAVGDGALGFWKALREEFPDTREQRYWFHKQSNVLAALLKSTHPGALAAMKEIYIAEDIDKAQLAIKAFELDYEAKYPKAVAKIIDDMDVLLEFYKYPGVGDAAWPSIEKPGGRATASDADRRRESQDACGSCGSRWRGE